MAVGSRLVLGVLLALALAAPASAQLPRNGSVEIVNTGPGTGEVSLIDQALLQSTDCVLAPGASCTRQFLVAPVLQLEPIPWDTANGYFTGWSLECDPPPMTPWLARGTPVACRRIDLDVFSPGGLSKRLEVNFRRRSSTLAVGLAGQGSGEVTSGPPGIRCTREQGSACRGEFNGDSVVTLRAYPDEDSRFIGWSGACGGTGACELTMDRPHVATAIFDPEPEAAAPSEDPPPQTRGLLITKRGNGEGRVRSVPRSRGIDCGSDCSELVPRNRRITLLARAQDGSRFAGWGGTCASATGATCRVRMSSHRHVRATFSRVERRLGVRVEGGGRVESVPGGITCTGEGGQCSAQFDDGDEVVLTPYADDGWRFIGWQGDPCTDTLSCPVRMDAEVELVARFARWHELAVQRFGTGAGTVTIRGPGGDLECVLTACLATFAAGTTVTLEPRPADGSTFGGFEGACTGTGPCTVVMDAEKLVRARFDAPPERTALGVSVLGPGEGRVTSDVPGIDCRPDCLEPYDLNTTVTLTARANPGSRLGRFAGPCAAVAGDTCTVRLDQARDVVVMFDRDPPFRADPPLVSTTPSGGGDRSVAARISRVRVRRVRGRRTVRVTLVAQERVTGTARLVRGRRTLLRRRIPATTTRRTLVLRVPRATRRGRVGVRLTLRDAAGNTRTLTRRVRLPR